VTGLRDAPGRTVWVALPYDDGGGQTKVMQSLADGLAGRGLNANVIVMRSDTSRSVNSDLFDGVGIGDAVVSAAEQRLSHLLAVARRAGRIAWWAVTVHSWGPLGQLSTLTENEAAAMAEADVVVSLCENHRANLMPQLSRHGARIRVIHNGVDVTAVGRGAIERVRIRERLGIGSEECLIAMLGQFDGRKRQDLALSAFSLLSERTDTPLRLLLAGDGPFRGAVQTAAVDAGLSEAVLVPGHVAEPSLLWAGSDVALLLSDHEVMPLALLEAAAEGLPLIANDVGCVSGVVVDGLTGRLCESAEPQGVAGAIGELADSSELRSAMGGAARELVSRRFSRATMVEDWIDLLAGFGFIAEAEPQDLSNQASSHSAS
jgi:glycosyltransferase involved in cell wall biosynthesis